MPAYRNDIRLPATFSRYLVVVAVLVSALSGKAYAQERIGELRRKLADVHGGVMIAAHRAAHAMYPENSIAAIEEAIRLGIDIIEIDVKVSSDGIPFLMHDRTMDRTTNGKGDPEMLTWSELQTLGIVDNGMATRYKIPSLEDALMAAKGKILVDLDLKTDRIDAVVKIVERTEMERDVLFFDSDYEVLKRVKACNKDLMIMPRINNAREAEVAVALFDPPVVHIDFDCYDDGTVGVIRNSESRVWINSLGQPDAELRKGKTRKVLKRLLGGGANIIQTDEPALLMEAVREKSLDLHPSTKY